ncbi:Fur family transcriptional regulator [Lactococcus taiwanensis]|uniref:Fur family transcriptional regulator n=1 Tax=Lactococcus taiwanensis TaxID=1151742 RepID=UPI003D0D3274
MEQDLKALLQEHGLKATSQRLIVLDYLISHQTHPTAEQIHEDLDNISLATVYNTLEKLIESELVIAINDGSKRRYDYYGDPHYHVVNKTTGEIINVDNFDFRSLIEAARQATGLTITGYKVEIYGIED